MSTLNIYTGTSNPILRQISKPVEKITKDTMKLIRNMAETMEKEEGVGLAAPQVGVHQRVILVAKMSNDDQDIVGVIPMINPEILEYSVEEVTRDEGCLSIPGKFAKVRRPKSVKVRYTDHKGQEITMYFHGISSQAVQHEIDHLDGILFTDKIVGPVEEIGKRKKEDGYLI